MAEPQWFYWQITMEWKERLWNFVKDSWNDELCDLVVLRKLCFVTLLLINWQPTKKECPLFFTLLQETYKKVLFEDPYNFSRVFVLSLELSLLASKVLDRKYGPFLDPKFPEYSRIIKNLEEGCFIKRPSWKWRFSFAYKVNFQQLIFLRWSCAF